MYSDTVLQNLIKSNIKLVISEAGTGVPILNALTSLDGASNILVKGKVPYSRDSWGYCMPFSREVSYPRVLAEAVQNKWCSYDDPKSGKAFGLAISGSIQKEKNKGQIHAWIAIASEARTTIGHVWLNKSKIGFATKAQCIEKLFQAYIWFIDFTILGNEDWENYHKLSQEYNFEFDFFVDNPKDDLAYWPHLISRTNPIYFSPIIGERLVDAVRAGVPIYRGSFNPPTMAHEIIGGNGIYEISLENHTKGFSDLDNINHRINMLRKIGKRVLLTMHPYFSTLFHRLSIDQEIQSPTFILGEDTVQRIIIDIKNFKDPHYRIMKHAINKPKFIVYNRGLGIKMPDCFETTYIDKNTSSISSTQVRAGDLSVVKPEVAEYIKEHHLYGA